MSKRSHDKQLARARAKRRQDRYTRRRKRTRVVVIVVILAMVATFAGVLAFAGGGGATPTPEVTDPAAAPSPGTSAAPSEPGEPQGAPGDVRPCPAVPDDEEPPEPSGAQFEAPEQVIDDSSDYRATVETNCGTFVIDLATAQSPATVNNFVFLARQGFYAGTPFHRVRDAFVIQGGDPTGSGSGGPGYQFDDELDHAQQVVAANDGNYPRGTVAMANSGPDTNGSQFFVVQARPGYPFEPNYAVFGDVVEGLDVVDRIAQGPAVGPSQDEAVNPVQIVEVTISEVAAGASASASPSASE